MWCSGLHRSEVAVELLGTFVKAPEEQRSEVKRPDAVADLLEAHVLLGENRADVQPAVVGGDDAIVLPTDAAVAAHAANFEIGRASCRERVEISVVAASLTKNR